MDIAHLIREKIAELPQNDQLNILNIIFDYTSCSADLKAALMNEPDGFKRLSRVSLLTKEMLGPYTKALLIDTDDGILAVDPEDYVVGWELRANGVFADGQAALLKEMVSPASRVLIVGAHIGTLAIPLSGHCADVVAIEANPQSFQLLELNLHINQITNCKTFNIAANDKEEQICFLLSRANSGGSKRKPLRDAHMYNYDNPLEIQVSAFPLDKLLKGQTFDVIVMDIEGSEYFALKGMPQLLSLSRALIVEFLPHHLRNVAGIGVGEFLSTLSYDTLTIPSLNRRFGRSEFSSILTYMYDNNMGDEGIIFERS